MESSLSLLHIVRAVSYCSSDEFKHLARWIKMPLGRKVGLNPSGIVLDWDPAPPPQKLGTAPQFLAHLYCGQMAAWI